MPPFAEWIKELWVLIQLWSVLQFLFLFGVAWGQLELLMTIKYKWGLGYSGVTEIPVVSMYEEGLGWTEVTYSGEPRLNLPEKLPLREE